MSCGLHSIQVEVHGLGDIMVANESPTGESVRYLEPGRHGEPARQVPRRTQGKVDRAAPQLHLAHRWLEAGILCGPDRKKIAPALSTGEYSLQASLWQCVTALSSQDSHVELPPFDVVRYADFCGRHRALRASLASTQAPLVLPRTRHARVAVRTAIVVA